MHDKEHKKKVLTEIAKLARTLIGDKLGKGAKDGPVAIEVEVIKPVPKGKRSKEELKKALGIG